MDLFNGLMAFILGLCMGSFVNMALWRLGHKKSLFKQQRSICDFCGKRLSWYDNVPVISWLFYKGKSRCCGKKLPLLYPVVEVLTGILFLINFIYFKNNLGLLIIDFIILSFLVFEAAFDFKYMMLPDATAYTLIVLAAVRWAAIAFPITYIFSALVSALFIFILHKIKIKGREAMGDGDVLLALFMGLFLGLGKVIVAFYVAFIVGAIVGGGMILLKKRGKLEPIAFGPFLILGTIVANFWGARIIGLFNFYF